MWCHAAAVTHSTSILRKMVPEPVSTIPAYYHGDCDEILRIPPEGFPETDRLVRKSLSLPLYSELESAGADRVIAAIRDFCDDRADSEK